MLNLPMKYLKPHWGMSVRWFALLLSIRIVQNIGLSQTALEGFEYGSDSDLAGAWTPSGNAVVTLSSSVSPGSAGTKSMNIQFTFPSGEWATEFVKGPELATPVAVAPTQYLTFRLKGDPAFTGADFRNLYLYVYDADGNFGRWGAPVPTTGDWQIRNHLASTAEKPWDSPALPDLSRLVRVAFFQYGSQTAIPEYTATVQVDDLMVRDTPLSETVTTVEKTVEAFEYASTEDLAAAWAGSANAVVTKSASVAFRSTGKASLQVEFNFPSSEWATEFVKGPELAEPMVIAPSQYLTFRIQGDPAFAKADFRNLYLYAYDDAGAFGRWGTEAPTTSDWKVLNFSAANLEKPWDSPNLPDLNRIVRFAFFQYGSQAAIDPYTATLHIDDLMVRNTVLTEFPAPAAPRVLIDDFEGFAGTEALQSSYTYMNSPAATTTLATLASPAPQGGKALQLAIDFAPGQYPWGSVRSAKVAPFSFPTNGVLSVRFKGAPGLASVAEDGTSFWVTFYDQDGRPIHYSSTAATVTSGEWTTLQVPFQEFRETSTADVGNLVQWRILVQGWTGTAEREAMSGTFQVDDLRITVPVVERPVLEIARQTPGVVLAFRSLVAGKAYELKASTDLRAWTTAATLQPTGATATWTNAAPASAGFYQLVEKTQ